MKKLLSRLNVLFAPFLKGQAPKLGSNEDPIRRMLFASQSLQQQASHIRLDGSSGPFRLIAEAARLAKQGKKKQAVGQLLQILKDPQLETRIQLWVWYALRELGERPDMKSATEVLGAVMEMPSGGAYDTLAAYSDGTARYLNYSGAAIFWDSPDANVKNLCQAFIASTIPASGSAKPRSSLDLPKHGAMITLLTRGGIYVFGDPPMSVVGPGAALMREMMNRSKQEE